MSRWLLLPALAGVCVACAAETATPGDRDSDKAWGRCIPVTELAAKWKSKWVDDVNMPHSESFRLRAGQTEIQLTGNPEPLEGIALIGHVPVGEESTFFQRFEEGWCYDAERRVIVMDPKVAAEPVKGNYPVFVGYRDASRPADDCQPVVAPPSEVRDWFAPEIQRFSPPGPRLVMAQYTNTWSPLLVFTGSADDPTPLEADWCFSLNAGEVYLRDGWPADVSEISVAYLPANDDATGSCRSGQSFLPVEVAPEHMPVVFEREVECSEEHLTLPPDARPRNLALWVTTPHDGERFVDPRTWCYSYRGDSIDLKWSGACEPGAPRVKYTLRGLMYEDRE